MAVWPTITDGVTRLGNALFTSIKAYIDDLVGGQGLPVGGATNDILAKTSATDYAVAWTDAPTVDSVTLDTAAAEATGIAKIYWDATEGTVAFGMAGGVVTQQLGRNAFVRAKNVTASQINRGQVVYLTGAQGDRPTIELADATDESTSADTIGIAAEDIAASAEGEVCISGILANVNTYGLTAGVMTYLSETAGAWTQTRPTQPAHGVRLGIPLKISNSPSGNSGVFFVQINNGYEFEELHDVLITTATAGDIIKRNAGNTLWVNAAPAALTKTDDTNVTLTLGGNPTTALVNAASLTLGWTGQLAVGRGGTGASTLTGYVYGNGASAMTASTTIPGSAITGDISGNAGTATTLQTARTLWGNSFNGSANVDGAITITAALGTGSEAFAIKNTTAGALGNTARMNFYLNNTTDAAAVNTARIEAVSTSASNRNTDLVFYTAQNLVAPAEQMRLTRDGRLGVGVTPISTAAVDIGTGFTTALALRVTSGGNGILGFYDSAGTTNYGRILWSAAQVQLNAISNIPLTFFTNNTERLRITNTGNVHPGSNAGGSLGILNTAWSSLFLSSGAVINFNAGDVTITHGADKISVEGGDLTVGTATAQGRITALTSQGVATVANAIMAYGANTSWPIGFSNVYDVNYVDSIFSINTRPVSGSRGSVLYSGSTAGYVLYMNGDGTGALSFQSVPGGSNQSATERMRITNSGHVQPGTNDGGQLGVSGTAWSDLFLASGGVINWNAGDTTLTHTAANILTLSSAATALRYNVYSTSNSGAPKVALLNGVNSCGIGLLGDSSGTMVFFAGDLTSERMRLTGAGLLGIGGTPNTYLLDVRGGVTADISIRGVTDSASNVESLRFFCQNTTEGGRISAVRTAASNAPNDLVFYTSVSGTVSECLRLTSGKNMVIPATSKFYLDGGGDTYITEGAANQIRMFTGGVDRFVVTDAQCYINVVYSQTTASAANVFVQSDGLLARSTSSLRYKRDVDTLGADHALAAVMAMRPVTYRGKTDEDQRHHVGFIAEEMAEIAPLLCTYDEGGESGTPNYVTYDRVTAYLVAVVQQQQAEIAALKARLN